MDKVRADGRASDERRAVAKSANSSCVLILHDYTVRYTIYFFFLRLSNMCVSFFFFLVCMCVCVYNVGFRCIFTEF